MSNVLIESGQRGGGVAENLVSHVATDGLQLHSLGCDSGNTVTWSVWLVLIAVLAIFLHRSIWPLLSILPWPCLAGEGRGAAAGLLYVPFP